MPENPDHRELRWLLHQVRPYRAFYLLRVCSVLLSSLLVLVDPLILKWLIDEVLPWREARMLVVAAAGLFLVHLFRFGLTAMSLLVDTYTGERLAFDLRNKLLRHLQALPPAYHLETPRGQLLHRLEQDVDQICKVGGHTLAALFRIAITTVLSVVIMLLLDWKLTLLLLPLVPLMVILRNRSQQRLKAASDRVQAATAARVTHLQDHLSSIVQVQLLNRGAGERRRWARLGRRAIAAQMAREGKELTLAFSSRLALITATALVLGFGGSQVLAGALTVGGLVAFYTYLSRIFGPVETVVRLYAEVQRAGAGIRRVREVLEVRPEPVDPPHPRPLRRTGPMAVRLAGVGFRYPASNGVLDGLNLELRPREKVALVGTTGSGKSTVARLLTRQYEPQEGRVLLDGMAIEDLRLRDVRSRVALVPQDPLLFDVTLEENLRYAAPRASREELHRALTMAQLAATLEELPDGWRERLGPRGERLSGGQRQRLAIARAVLQQPRLLVLDEASSALDGFTEHRLLTALEEWIEDCTVLLIAHRLSAIRWADRVFVLDGGRAVAAGTHPQLYRHCDLYRRLCREQRRDDDRRDAEPEAATLREVMAS